MLFVRLNLPVCGYHQRCAEFDLICFSLIGHMVEAD